jgi:UDPglucose 6-dehydrogenase
MAIAIAGHGFVGHAVAAKFSKHMDIIVVDPKLGPETVANYSNVDGVIICVTTPSAVNGSCDYSRVADVLETVDSAIPVLVKSAVDINGVLDLKKRFPNHSITYSPEFLRADTADRDFAAQDYVIFGGGDQDFWLNTWTRAFPYIESHLITDIEASILKYAENSFLATKVSFFNQLYDLCEAVGADFESVRYSLCRDARINPDHSHVTAERGWGGHCFPKDTTAMIKQAREAGAPFTVLEQACIYNNKVRNG